MIKSAIKSVNSALAFVLLAFGIALLPVAVVLLNLAPLILAVEAHGWWKLLAIPSYYVLFVFDVLVYRWAKENFHRLNIGGEDKQ